MSVERGLRLIAGMFVLASLGLGWCGAEFHRIDAQTLQFRDHLVER